MRWLFAFIAFIAFIAIITLAAKTTDSKTSPPAPINILEADKTTASIGNKKPNNTWQTQVDISTNKLSDIGKVFQLLWNWFTDGNTFVRIGIVILFLGVSFLLNFAIKQGFISIELRLVATAVLTIYALLIRGGAVGLLYLLTIIFLYGLGFWQLLFATLLSFVFNYLRRFDEY